MQVQRIILGNTKSELKSIKQTDTSQTWPSKDTSNAAYICYFCCYHDYGE